MHAHHRYHHHGWCHEEKAAASGPAIYYGYDHQAQRLRMMDYGEYMNNVQTGVSNMVNAMQAPMQAYMQALGYPYPAGRGQQREHDYDCGCGCHEHAHKHEHEHEHHRRCGCHEREHECHCHCCIRCADTVEYARCGEVRQIPITFDNDSRRTRDVTLDLGAFATSGGKELRWKAELSETKFTLPPCGEKTVLLKVLVDCSVFEHPSTTTTGTGSNTPPATGNQTAPPTGNVAPAPPPVLHVDIPSVHECKVAYATIRAEGCFIRPLVVAVAVLPNDCGSHRAGCLCGCCHCH